jgi:hypothetical protein
VAIGIYPPAVGVYGVDRMELEKYSFYAPTTTTQSRDA